VRFRQSHGSHGAARPAPLRHSRQKVQARSAVPFAVKLLPGFQVDGTWNVPTYFIPGGRHMECAYTFDFGRLAPLRADNPD